MEFVSKYPLDTAVTRLESLSSPPARGVAGIVSRSRVVLWAPGLFFPRLFRYPRFVGRFKEDGRLAVLEGRFSEPIPTRLAVVFFWFTVVFASGWAMLSILAALLDGVRALLLLAGCPLIVLIGYASKRWTAFMWRADIEVIKRGIQDALS